MVIIMQEISSQWQHVVFYLFHVNSESSSNKTELKFFNKTDIHAVGYQCKTPLLSTIFTQTGSQNDYLSFVNTHHSFFLPNTNDWKITHY